MKLKNIDLNKIFVSYDNQLRPLTNNQCFTLLKYRLTRKYNKKYLNIDPPYFFENNMKRDIYFLSEQTS